MFMKRNAVKQAGLSARMILNSLETKERPRQTGRIYYYILMLLQNTECSPAAETVKAAYSQNWVCRKYWSCQARDACFYHFGVLKLEVLHSKRSSSFQDPLIHHSRCPCPAPDSVSGGVKASSLWKAALSTWRQQQQHSQSLWTPEMKQRNHWHEQYRSVPPR